MPSDSTIHRRHHDLAELGDDVRQPLTAAMKTIRTQAWNKLGPRNPATRATVDNPLVIDIDATEITAHSDKEQASATWKKHFGFHPLCAFIDLGDDHGRGHRWWGWEPKTIRARMIRIAAVITRHARRLILRVDRAAPWQSLLRAVLGHQQHRTPS